MCEILALAVVNRSVVAEKTTSRATSEGGAGAAVYREMLQCRDWSVSSVVGFRRRAATALPEHNDNEPWREGATCSAGAECAVDVDREELQRAARALALRWLCEA
jgi:hypothetical protein